MKENNQKIKLIKLSDYLKLESSEEKPLSTQTLIAYLKNCGISCDRRTLYRDMNTLSEQGLNIIKTECGRENGYYIEDDSFSIAEIKVLIDAVQSANFLTNTKTEDLIRKLLNLTGVRKQEAIMDNVVFYNSIKHSNEDIYHSIEQLEIAVEKKKQVSFYYFDLDENSNRVYRKEKDNPDCVKRYITDPVALIFESGNYYLLSYSQKYENNTIYRIDRMSEVSVEDNDICDEAKIRKRTTANYTKQVFRMYGGEIVDIVLQSTFKGLGMIYDKFGEDTKIKKVNDMYIAKLKVQVSPPFWGWLFQCSEEIELIEPINLKHDLKKVFQCCKASEEKGTK